MTNQIFVLYHKNCLDGSGSRFSAYKRFKDRATYIPVQYGEKFPRALHKAILGDQSKNVELYILDFSYKRKLLDFIYARVGKLQVVDHHKTAKEELNGLPYAIFDMKKSGAYLSWEYFHPHEIVPEIILHVSDRDLWQFKLPGTDAINAALAPEKENMDSWERYLSIPELEGLLQRGLNLTGYRDGLVRRSLRNVQVRSYKGYRVGVTNESCFFSELGHAIVHDKTLSVDFSMTFFVHTDGYAVISFRSSEDGTDVEAVAKELGGGGHPHASGARVSLSFISELLANKL